MGNPGTVSRTFAIMAALAIAAAGCGGRGKPWARTGVKSPILCLMASGDHVWAGTAEGLVLLSGSKDAPVRYVWTGPTLSVTRIPGNRPVPAALKKDMEAVSALNSVREMTPWKGGIAIATAAGVIIFSPAQSSVTSRWGTRDGLASDSVRSVTAARNGLWAATIFGACRLSADGKRWKSYGMERGLIQKHVYRMADDGKNLWASCINGGLVRYDPATDRWKAVAQEHALGNASIYSFAPGPQGLWMGTRGGVNLLTAPAHWNEEVCADGFTEFSVYALALSGNDLWFGTGFGLYHRDLVSGKQVLITEADGLPSDEVSALAISGKYLWIGTSCGPARMEISAPRN